MANHLIPTDLARTMAQLPPPDFDAIQQTLQLALHYCAAYPQHENGWLAVYAQDVPALLAVIDRLREQLIRQEAHQEVSRG